MEIKNLHLKQWLLSNQDYLPVLILIDKNFGVNEPLFADSCKKYWPNITHYQSRMPSIESINKLISDKKRVLITTHSLESLVKWSKLESLSNEDVDYLCSKLLIVNDFDSNFTKEELIMYIFNLKCEYQDEIIESKPYSKNLQDYIYTLRSPEYFINELFIRFEDTNDKDYPVQISGKMNKKFFINIDLFMMRFPELFGIQCPFDSIELKRWIWERSERKNYQAYIGGRKYREFTTYSPTL